MESCNVLQRPLYTTNHKRKRNCVCLGARQAVHALQAEIWYLRPAVLVLQALPKDVSIDQLPLGSNTMLVPQVDYNVSQSAAAVKDSCFMHMC
jgi:hypothetical protein